MSPFNRYAKEYDLWYEKNKYIYHSELSAIRFLMPKRKKGLEVGVGTGRFAGPLGIKYGVEPSENMSVIARKKGIKVLNGTAEKLSFENNIFDFVLFVTTLCFVKDVRKALSEAVRVLKKNGAIVIGMIDRGSSLGKRYYNKQKSSKYFKAAKMYTAKEIIDILEPAGFHKFTVTQTIFDKSNRFHEFRPGYGEGLFVAIKAMKNSKGGTKE